MTDIDNIGATGIDRDQATIERDHDEHRLGAYVERGATSVTFAAERLHHIVRPSHDLIGLHDPEVYEWRPCDGHVARYIVDPSTGCIVALVAPPNPTDAALSAAPDLEETT